MGHDHMGFVVGCLLEYNPAPVKEPLCKTKHSCVKRSTSSYWKADGRRFKRTIHTPPHVCFFYFLHVYFYSLLSSETSACFFPAPGHLNAAEYPLLLTCPKLRFRFCFGSQKKKHILHILFFDQRTGPPRNGVSPLLPAYLWAAVSLASLSLSICSPKACPKALFRFICVQQMFPQLSCNAVVCRLLSLFFFSPPQVCFY